MLYIILLIILVGLDQVSKYLIEANFFEGETIPLLSNFFHLTYVKNRGVAFGMFQGKIPVISIVTVIAIIGIAWYVLKCIKEDKSKVEIVAYIFILSGAIGNMIDRAFRGFVVDMVDFRGIWSYVFNLADVWINIGVALILISEFIISSKKKQNR